MPELDGSKTHANLLTALASDAEAQVRYLWFAQNADVEGYPDIAALFRSAAERRTGRAQGHLEYLADVGDPATGERIGDTADNLAASIAGEEAEGERYVHFVATARAEGLNEVAEWFETMSSPEQGNADRFADVLSVVRPREG